MTAHAPTIGFAGDLGDPWVAAIARALATFHVEFRAEPDGGMPWGALAPGSGLDILVLHRSRLSADDADRMEALWRERGPDARPRVILCVSPYVRYAEVERCAALVDLVMPEAVAAETLPHRIERMLERVPGQADRSRRGAIPVEVVSTDFELRRVLREAAALAGYRAVESASLAATVDPAAGRALTVWDVPVLEPRWEERLEHRSLGGPVLALLGFADREAVGRTRAAGASACLDLPCALDDLIDALDRMARTPIRPRAEPAHAAPAGPVGRGARPRSRLARGVG